MYSVDGSMINNRCGGENAMKSDCDATDCGATLAKVIVTDGAVGL